MEWNAWLTVSETFWALLGTCARISDAWLLLLLRKPCIRFVSFSISPTTFCSTQRLLCCPIFGIESRWKLISGMYYCGTIRRYMASIVCFYQGGSKREFEIESTMCAAAANYSLCSCSSALIHTISDLYNLPLCKWLGEVLKSLLLQKLRFIGKAVNSQD